MKLITILVAFILCVSSTFAQGHCDSLADQGAWKLNDVDSLNKIAKNFTCELISKGVDTLLIVKFKDVNEKEISDRISVLWQRNGQGFEKSFHIVRAAMVSSKKMKKDKFLAPSDSVHIGYIEVVDLNPILGFFSNNNVMNDVREPETGLGHPIYSWVQLIIGKTHYKFTIVNTAIRDINETSYARTVWLKLILRALKCQ